MTLVAGVDSSTQSVKVVVVDAAAGTVVREGSAPHPVGTEVHPDAWWDALRAATADGLLDGVEAVSVAAQQHGLVALDAADEVVRPALLWNDLRSAADAADLVAELGGPAVWAESVGSVPVASFTVTKLRWLRRAEPALADRVRSVLLPHDWLTLRLGSEGPVTDRGDASGTGYFAPADGTYRPELLVAAFGAEPRLPRVAGPAEAVGRTAAGAVLGPGTGDNMGAALGLGLGPGDVVVSLGTSGTVFAVATTPGRDATGAVAGFADATGRFLPLVCTLNAARVLDAGRRLLGVDPAEFDALALAAPPGAGGLTLVPYLEGERTPDLPDATGRLVGMTLANSTREHLARAVAEGVVCALADGLDALVAQGVTPRRVLLIGGGARSAAVRAVAAALVGVPVEAPEPAEYVALGAARQAAWVLAGTPEPPAWPVSTVPVDGAGEAAEVRVSYARARDELVRLHRH
jgi:xylulokinase